MRSTEIESYFVQYLLVRICAEYETRVTTLVHRRCSRTTDPHLKSFAQQTATYVCQRFSIGDIAKVLGRFGVDYKQAFHGQVMSGMAHVAWDNIYTNRQAVAHKTGTQMSLGDLKKDYGDSRDSACTSPLLGDNFSRPTPVPICSFPSRVLCRGCLRSTSRHYHHERNHQGKGNRLLFPGGTDKMYRPNRNIACHQRLGGLLSTTGAPHEYFYRTRTCPRAT